MSMMLYKRYLVPNWFDWRSVLLLRICECFVLLLISAPHPNLKLTEKWLYHESAFWLGRYEGTIKFLGRGRVYPCRSCLINTVVSIRRNRASLRRASFWPILNWPCSCYLWIPFGYKGLNHNKCLVQNSFCHRIWNQAGNMTTAKVARYARRKNDFCVNGYLYTWQP